MAFIWSKSTAVTEFPCFLKHFSIIAPNNFLSTTLSISKEYGSLVLSTNPKSWGYVHSL